MSEGFVRDEAALDALADLGYIKLYATDLANQIDGGSGVGPDYCVERMAELIGRVRRYVATRWPPPDQPAVGCQRESSK